MRIAQRPDGVKPQLIAHHKQYIRLVLQAGLLPDDSLTAVERLLSAFPASLTSDKLPAYAGTNIVGITSA